jgi:hypothetical protein
MACSYGNFFLVTEWCVGLLRLVPERDKKMAIDDNRLSDGLSESWHPPESALPIS